MFFNLFLPLPLWPAGSRLLSAPDWMRYEKRTQKLQRKDITYIEEHVYKFDEDIMTEIR